LPFRHDGFVAAIFVFAAAAVGAVGWSGQVAMLPAAAVFPALWAFAPSRLVSGLVAAAYFQVGSRGLPIGVARYFDAQIALGIGLWVAAAVPFVAVHATLWTPQARWRPVRYALVLILMAVPPLGIVGWGSPLTAAGILFPGWGWFGLAIMAMLLLGMTTRMWPVTCVTLGALTIVSAATWSAPQSLPGWLGIDTEFQLSGSGRYGGHAQQRETIGLVREAAEQGAKVVVLPEGALGIWTTNTERFWRRELAARDLIVLGGATVVTPGGYDNVIVGITPSTARAVYTQRMPVPVSMWQPWTQGGARAGYFAQPVIEIAGLRAAPLICYEQLLVWPVLHSFLQAPDVLVAIGNGWWAGGSGIDDVQSAAVVAWAALFGVPLVRARNT
jgi:hypothetical protein